jgi:GMP synthase (glutamine-hydrolysing)
MAKPLLVVLTGTTVPIVKERHGDFDAHFRAGIGDAWKGDFVTVDARALDTPLPALDSVAGVVVSGSSSSVTERAPWMLRLEGWLRDAVARETPLLGVCFGHQILAQALGGEVRKNPRGRRIGTHTVRLVEAAAEDPILRGLPDAFDANLSHQDHVGIVPPSVQPLVTADHDALHAFAAGRFATGVQFHPEFHDDIMRGYITTRRDLLAGEGLDPDALHGGVRDAPYARSVLGNFVRGFVLGPGRTRLPA